MLSQLAFEVQNIGFQEVKNTSKTLFGITWSLCAGLHVDIDDGEKYLAVHLFIQHQNPDV